MNNMMNIAENINRAIIPRLEAKNVLKFARMPKARINAPAKQGKAWSFQ